MKNNSMITQELIPYILALIINNNNEVLLLYRINNNYFSNHYGLPGGKIDNNESGKQALARELFEELGIIFASEDVEFVHVMHFMGETGPCIALLYTLHTWHGDLYNKEPKKHEHLAWFPLDKLPENIIPRHRMALERISQKIMYSENNW